MFASADYHYRRRKNPVKALYTVISAIKITFIFDKVVAVFQFRISLLGRSSLMAGARHNRMVTGLLWGSYAIIKRTNRTYRIDKPGGWNTRETQKDKSTKGP